MTEATKSRPLALHVPEPFTYVDRGLQRASDWIRYTVHPGLYRIRFLTSTFTPIDANTIDEARAYCEAKRDQHIYVWPDMALARLAATKVESYYENQLLSAVSGHRSEHHEPTTVSWRPYGYDVHPGAKAFHEWVGTGTDRTLVHYAEVVEMRDCAHCGAPAGQPCRTGCDAPETVAADGRYLTADLVAANAGSAS